MSGKVSGAGSDSCDDPNTGYYSNNGVETGCTSIDYATFTSHGGTSATGCTFTCNVGYGTVGRSCTPKTPAVASVTITGLTPIDGSKKGTSSRSLTVSISATNVSHYYLTHIAPGSTFTPKGITGQGATEGKRTWSSATLSSYALPPSLSDGEHKLYLWVANVEKDIFGSSNFHAKWCLYTGHHSTLFLPLAQPIP